MAAGSDIIQSVNIPFYRNVKDRYPVVKMFLYGSYAKCNYRPDSDIDVAVVIDAADHSRRIEITADLFRLARTIHNAIEPKCIFRDEWETCENASILSEIIRSGVDISAPPT